MKSIQKQERALFLGFLLELAGFLPALVVAIFSGSMLLMGDLPAYGRGIFTTFMGWQILRSIRRGRIHGFDYGTDKIQAMGGMIGSMLYLGTLVLLAGWAIGRLFEPAALNPTFTLLGALLQFVEFAFNVWLWRYNRRLSELEFSPVMEMQWRTYRADALMSLAMMISLGLALLLRDQEWAVYLDPMLALCFIAYVSISFLPTLANTLNDLLDKTLQEDLQLRIDRRLAEHFDDYVSFGGVRSRRAGGRVFIEIELGFDPESTTAKTISTVRQLRDKLQGDIPGSEVRVILVP